jgi:hypothetical protein
MQLHAEIPPSLPAQVAFAARQIDVAANPLRHLPALDLIPLLVDHAGKFMAQDAGKNYPWVFPQVGVKIGTADGAGFHPYQNFVRSDRRNRQVFQTRIFAAIQDSGPVGVFHFSFQ